MFNGILANRHYEENLNGWYAPLHFLQSFKSVINADYWNTCNSSGDWSGFFVQKIKNDYFLLLFNQENKIWHGGGYELNTTGVIASWRGYEMEDEEIYKIISDYEKMYQ